MGISSSKLRSGGALKGAYCVIMPLSSLPAVKAEAISYARNNLLKNLGRDPSIKNGATVGI